MILTDNIRGALLMIGSMTAFTINDAFMKALSDDLSLYQAIFLRAIGVTLFLAGFAWSKGALTLHIPKPDRKLIAIRSAAEVAAALLFITALFNMPLANATAILQALPLTVTLAGAVFLREPVGWRRLLAILIGLIGVLLIVQPGSDGFTIYSLYALAAVCLITLRDLAARQISKAVPSLTVALFAGIAVGLGGAVGTLFTPWQPVSGDAGLLLVAAAISVIGGYVFSVATMRIGEIGFVSQFRYASLISAMILGFIFFNEWPDALTLTGAVIVVGTGLFTLWRERAAANP